MDPLGIIPLLLLLVFYFYVLLVIPLMRVLIFRARSAPKGKKGKVGTEERLEKNSR